MVESMLIPRRLFEHARRRPTHPAYFTKEQGAWTPTNWEVYATQIRQAGKAMIALGIEPGKTVCILGFTSPEWVIFDVACMTIGGVPAGIYTTSSPEECEYILNHAEASLLLIEAEEQWEKLRKVRANLSFLEHVVTMKRSPLIDDPQVMSWEAFLAKGEGVGDDEAATEEALSDGWLLTGDIGRIDDDGYMYIVDRKKHIIITAGGKNVTPANIEHEIKTRDAIISHVHAHGDRRPYVTALMTLDPAKAIDFGLERGLLHGPGTAEELKLALTTQPQDRTDELEELMKAVAAHPDLRQRIVQATREANEKLSRVEQVKRVYLLDRELSIEEDEITPTMKVKRKKVEKKFAPVFDRLYEDESFGIVVMEK